MAKSGGGFGKGVMYGAVAQVIVTFVLVGVFHKLSMVRGG